MSNPLYELIHAKKKRKKQVMKEVGARWDSAKEPDGGWGSDHARLSLPGTTATYEEFEEDRPVGDAPRSRYRLICLTLIVLKADPVDIAEVLADRGMDLWDLKQRHLTTKRDEVAIWDWAGWDQHLISPGLELALKLLRVPRRKKESAKDDKTGGVALVLPTLDARLIRLMNNEQFSKSDQMVMSRLAEKIRPGRFHSRHDMLLAQEVSQLFTLAGKALPIIMKASRVVEELAKSGAGVDNPPVTHGTGPNETVNITTFISIGLFTNPFTQLVAQETKRFGLVDNEDGRNVSTRDKPFFAAPNEEEPGVIAFTRFRKHHVVILGGLRARGTARLGTFLTHLDDMPHVNQQLSAHPTPPALLGVNSPGNGRRFNFADYSLVGPRFTDEN